MKSATGKSRAAAFTLLELLVVIFLIAVLSAGALLVLGPEDEERAIEGACARLSSLARMAHREAARSGEAMVIVFDPRGFDLVSSEGVGEAGGARIAGHEVEGAVEIRIRDWGQENWAKADGFRWEFPPLGISQPLTVRFRRGAAGITVWMDPLTGAIRKQEAI